MSGWVDAEYSSCWDEDDSPPGPNSISCEDGVGALHISREVSIKGGMYYNIIDEITRAVVVGERCTYLIVSVLKSCGCVSHEF